MKQKSIVVVMGSPRKEGNSATLARQIIAGAEENGAQVESFYLHGMNIQPCHACYQCNEALEDDCVRDDDMQSLYPKLRQADAIVIASPIYFFTVSAQTKLFIDRCYALLGPDEETAFKGKQIGIVLTYGDKDPFSSGAVNALRLFQDMFNYTESEIVGMIYGSAEEEGEIRENNELMKEAFELGKKMAS